MTADRINPPADHPSPEELTGYADRELDPAVMIRLRAHIESCPDCTTHLGELSRIDDLGAALNEDLPGPQYWPGLKERILRRVDEEGGAAEAADPSGSRPVIVESPPKRSRFPRFSGWTPVGWTVATAAALGFVVLTARGLLHQSSPVEPEFAPRSGKLEARQAPPRSPEIQSGERAETAVPEAGGIPAGRKDKRDERGLSGGAADQNVPADAKVADELGAVAPVTPPAEAPKEPGPAGGEILLREDRLAMKAPAAAPPAPAAGKGADAAGSGSWGAVKSTESAITDQPRASATMEVSADDDPVSYVADVDARLARAREGASRDRLISPGGDRRGGLADRDSSSPTGRETFKDLGIVYAAAVRALDAGEFDLAARGFDIVSRRGPESDLARDADYQGRMARIRARIAGGEDRRQILKEAGDRAEASFRRATDKPDRAACREALADERVRIRLLEEIEPAVNREPFEERVRSLSRCS